MLKSTLSVDTSVRPIGDVMERLSALGGVLDITISNPPMEDIIAAIFRSQEGAMVRGTVLLEHPQLMDTLFWLIPWLSSRRISR